MPEDKNTITAVQVSRIAVALKLTRTVNDATTEQCMLPHFDNIGAQKRLGKNIITAVDGQ